MATHRAAGKAQVRTRCRNHSRVRGHRAANPVAAAAVRTGVLGALATATIAVPLATAATTPHLSTGDGMDLRAAFGADLTTSQQPGSQDLDGQLEASAPSVDPIQQEALDDVHNTQAEKLLGIGGQVGASALAAPPKPPGPAQPDSKQKNTPKFIVPAPGAAITSGYGWRTHPILGYSKLHDGVDYGAPCGAPVLASAAGTVIEVEFNEASGRRIFIDHGDGVITGYFHLQSYKVKLGQKVAQGDVIATVGSTGRSTGCHLHFAKRSPSGEYSNPMTLFTKKR
ncbi:M23 family metallopeptidase [Devriesea agamarum]|uniref:M23 family metallopeptidase n=1 Tax=Devriesea agamarum TaxID=472569 RepID=UPI00071D3AC6|nr:M23 family metallopeptidase [Devriesea agamarum]